MTREAAVVRRDIGRGLEIHSGGDPPMWHAKSRRPDVPGPAMRYFFLVYVLFVFMGPLMGRGTWREWSVAAASIGLFLPLYFGYWTALERRSRHTVLYVAAIGILGFVLVPFNTGSTTFLIYSAALVPFVVSPRRALAYISGLVVATLLIAFTVPGLSTETRVWIAAPTVLLVAMIGVANVFFAENSRRNARLWRAQEDVEEMATVAERERISRDLHDLLGHTLSVIALKAELASKLADSDSPRAADEIRDVERISRDALTEVRSAVEGFRGRGMSGELRHASRALESAGVRFEAESVDVRMSPRHEAVMALALREAVTNVVRHARAATCRVSLCLQKDCVVLMVQDDGAGGEMREGHGLAGMRERAAAVGGTVTVDGSRGTLVTVRLPASQSASGQSTA